MLPDIDIDLYPYRAAGIECTAMNIISMIVKKAPPSESFNRAHAFSYSFISHPDTYEGLLTSNEKCMFLLDDVE
jgi:hypothetical protein